MKKILNIEDAHRLARKRLPLIVSEFIDGGAEDEHTLRSNESALDKVTFQPRILVDVSRRDQTTTVLGDHINLPVMLAPVGAGRLVSRQGELAVARGAAAAKTIFMVSTFASNSLEEIADVSDGPLWFQMYMSSDRELNSALVQRAYKAGYRALCLTVDTAAVGKRERDLRLGASYPPRITLRTALNAIRKVSWLRDYLFGEKELFGNFKKVAKEDIGKIIYSTINPLTTWEDLDWLRKEWDRPLLVKGILSKEDAHLAVDHGVDGIVVSNHGGRQLDSAPSTIEVLPEIVDAIGNKLEIFFDGGIRRGGDVLKAIAIGARACLIGRPYMWGLAIGGEVGVARVLEILREEIDRTMALIGRTRLNEMDRTAIRTKLF